MTINLIEHQDALHAIAYSICKNKHLANDIVQDVLVEALTENITSIEELKKRAAKKAAAAPYEKYKNPATPIGKIGNLDDEEGVDFRWNTIAADPVFFTESEKEEELELARAKIESIQSANETWVDFETARAFVRTLGMKGKKAWKSYCKSGRKPKNIPSTPERIYPQFISFYDWLGYGFFTYQEAEIYVQSVLVPQGIDSKKKWEVYRKEEKLEERLPSSPPTTYKNRGWISWSKFFGIKRRSLKKIILPYKEAKRYVQENLIPKGIDTLDKYHAAQLPDFLPSDPPSYYKTRGWINSADFFGTNHTKIFEKKDFWPYEKAREWVRLKLRIEGIDTVTKWHKYVRGEFPNIPIQLPLHIPHDAASYYTRQGVWRGWSDFLGKISKRRDSKKFWDYTKAKQWVFEKLSPFKLTRRTWEKYADGRLPDLPELPVQIPKRPWTYYKKTKEWKGLSDWLGFTNSKGRKAEKDAEKATKVIKFVLPYAQAKEYVQLHLAPKGINSSTKFRALKNIPSFIPKEPHKSYKEKGWNGWDDFLGRSGLELTQTRQQKKARNVKNVFLPYQLAEAYVQEHLVPQGICTRRKYQAYKFLPSFLPTNPEESYKNKGWVAWNIFFKQENIEKRLTKSKSLPFEQAKEYVRKNLVPKGIDSLGKYIRHKDQLPPFLPTRPDEAYKNKGWKGANDFFGTNYQKFSKGSFVSMDEAAVWVKQHVAETVTDLQKWRAYVRGEYPHLPSVPDFIPKVPDITYKKQGWKGYKKWIGLKEEYLSFADAKKCVMEHLIPQGIRSRKKYIDYPDLASLRLPLNPRRVYWQQGWNGWDDYFGIEKSKTIVSKNAA